MNDNSLLFEAQCILNDTIYLPFREPEWLVPVKPEFISSPNEGTSIEAPKTEIRVFRPTGEIKHGYYEYKFEERR